MSKSSKIFLGILSFLPLVLVCLIIIFFFNLFPQILEWERNEPDAFTVIATFSPIFITGIITALVSLALLVIFIIHMVNNKKMEPVEKLIWVLVFLFAGIIGYPIYWFMRIWNEMT